MSRVKIKQELIYFPKNIRRNIVKDQQIKQPQERPKSSKHRGYFSSIVYHQKPDNRTQSIENALKTVQLNKQLYVANESSPQRKNIKSFMQTYQIERFKQKKIRSMTIQGRLNYKKQNDKMQEFVAALIDSNIFFQRLQRTMVESLSLIGSKKIYQKGQKFQLGKKNIGFVLYGKLKIFDKDYSFIANRGDTIGQNQFFNNSKSFSVKILTQSAILWIPFSSFSILRQQTVRQGFRHQFNKIQTQLRLNYIKKKIPKQ